MNQSSWTVLIVEDSPEDRKFYQRCLQRDWNCSYTFLEASQVSEALNLWHQHHPDVVLLDYRLPDGDGLDFLKHLQPCSQTYPVLMITGQGNEAIAVQAMKAGAQDYLIKEELTPIALQRAVNGAIERVKLQIELQQRIDRERVISQIARKIHCTLDVQEVLQTTVTEVRQLLQADRVLIYQLQPDRQGSVIVESVGEGWSSLLHRSLHDVCFNPVCIKTFRQGLIVAESEIPGDTIASCQVEKLATLQVQANLVVPILIDQQLWGTLIVHQCATPRQWQPTEVALLEDLATHVGIAVRQAELYQQAQTELVERQRIEAELRDSEARFRNMADNAPVMIWVTDATGYCTYLSQSWYEFTGQTPESGLGFGWLNALHPEDMPNSQQLFLAATTCQQPFRKEYQLRRNDGQYRWAIDAAHPRFDSEGQFNGFIGSVIDITDRKLAEQRLVESEGLLRLAMQVTGFALAKFDYATNTVELSPETAALYGLPLDQLTVSREQIHATFHPDERTELLQIIEQVLDPNGAGWFERDHRVVWQNGEERWLSVRKQVFFDRSTDPPRPTHAVLVALDVTDRKLAETEREQLLAQEQAARTEAERANRVKDEFLAVLSHELRSPLNPILGWSQLLRSRRFNQEKVEEALAAIERNAKLQTQLIDDLLDTAKILTGKLTVTAVPVNLVDVTTAAIETIKTAIQAKAINLQVQIHTPKLIVLGDATRLQQIIWNLLSNAIKFTPQEGRVTVSLTSLTMQLHSTAHEQSYAEIVVTDTGKGISPATLPHIFKSFWQEDASTTRKYGGLGLGLAIVRHLVESHGGTVTAESAGAGQGATFTVRLPLLKEVPLSPQPEQSQVQPLTLAGKRILLVDDELDARKLLTTLLTQFNATVMAVASATDALLVLDSFQPTVLVSDIGMPNMDGYMLVKQIRDRSPQQGGQIPAIALTAYAREDDRQRSLAAGFQSHITKPVEIQQLVQAIIACTS